ncbi:MAG: hypothetical protein AB9903_35800 [Vulcanimicrobiota bacterium]
MKGKHFALFCVIAFIVAVVIPAYAEIPGFNVTGTDGQPMKSETFIFKIVGTDGADYSRMEPLEITTDDKGFLKFPAITLNNNVYFIQIQVKNNPAVSAIMMDVIDKDIHYRTEPLPIKMGTDKIKGKFLAI